MKQAMQQATEWESLVDEICQDLAKLTGNVFSDKQRPMVEARMRRRVLDLKLSGPGDYRLHRRSHLDEENKVLIGLLTTHFTSFFREFSHFEWLASYLPTMIAAARAEGRRSLSIWSAACSKGQEVWSLGMWLQAHVPKIDPSMNWEILGTDIDGDSVKEAENAVYHRRELETAPRHLWEEYWMRGTGEISDWYKAKKDLRSKAKFGTMNLLDLKLKAGQKFDLIVCRNVLIYFDRKNQEKIARSLLSQLTDQGVLITGVSESLSSYNLDVQSLSVSVYKVKSEKSTPVALPTVAAPASVVPQLPKPLKVFCIDDSSTVLTILKKVLNTSEVTVIGTACHGLDAIEKLKTLKPDVITLDLHMPEMDGPTFLKTSGIAAQIPVIVMSSVGRDDASIVTPLFNQGVCDFVEKPTLANMEKVGEELVQKLKMGWLGKKKGKGTPAAVTAPAKKTRARGHVIFHLGHDDLTGAAHTLKQQDWSHDEVTIIVPTTSSNDLNWMKKLKAAAPANAQYTTVDRFTGSVTKTQTLWLSYKNADAALVKRYKTRSQLLVTEDAPGVVPELRELSDDVSPFTSFSYLAEKYLAGN